MNSLKAIVSLPSSLVWVACVAVSACGGAPDASADAVDSVSEALSSNCPPAVPDPSLAVPAGNDLAFNFDAVGVQIYACQATATAFAWTFTAPEANLLGRHGRVVGKHYAGPTWEAKDGSKVVGARIAGITVDATAIPWLLLQAASHEGEGTMSEVTYIQRLDTQGGLAPASGCDADHVGAIARVYYTATYFFYEAAKGKSCRCR